MLPVDKVLTDTCYCHNCDTYYDPGQTVFEYNGYLFCPSEDCPSSGPEPANHEMLEIIWPDPLAYYTTHVAVYDMCRAYGGPEEGGWDYDTGRLMTFIKVPARAVMHHGYLRVRPHEETVTATKKFLEDVCGFDFTPAKNYREGWSKMVIARRPPPSYIPIVKPRYE